MFECSFLIPVRRDANLSDGDLHPIEVWQWLNASLYDRFSGRTLAPGFYEGVYKDPDTGLPVQDQSRRYIIAIPDDRINDLRDFLREACEQFQQKCIYLSVAGRVEFIGPEHDEP
jgi:hypothetical protein